MAVKFYRIPEKSLLTIGGEFGIILSATIK